MPEKQLQTVCAPCKACNSSLVVENPKEIKGICRLRNIEKLSQQIGNWSKHQDHTDTLHFLQHRFSLAFWLGELLGLPWSCYSCRHAKQCLLATMLGMNGTSPLLSAQLKSILLLGVRFLLSKRLQEGQRKYIGLTGHGNKLFARLYSCQSQCSRILKYFLGALFQSSLQPNRSARLAFCSKLYLT